MSGVGVEMIPGGGREREPGDCPAVQAGSGPSLPGTTGAAARPLILQSLCDTLLVVLLVAALDLAVLLVGKGPFFSTVREQALLFPALLGITWPWMLVLLILPLIIINTSRMGLTDRGAGALVFPGGMALLGVGALLFFHWILRDLLQGPSFANWPGLPVLGWAGALVAASVWVGVLVGMVRWGRIREDRREGKVKGEECRPVPAWGRVLAGVTLTGVALGLHWVDGNVLIRLYPRLHGGVFFLTCTLLVGVVVLSGLGERLATRVALVWGANRPTAGSADPSSSQGGQGGGPMVEGTPRHRWWPRALLVLAAVGLLGGTGALGSDRYLYHQANLRFQIVSKCPGAGKLVLMGNRASGSLSAMASSFNSRGRYHRWDDPGVDCGTLDDTADHGAGRDGGTRGGDAASGDNNGQPGPDGGRGGRRHPTGYNLVLVTMDAVRASHCSVYGFERNTTPFLEELARESTLFTRAYTQSSHTSYSLSMLMSSRYMYQPQNLDLARLPTMASVFGQAGYATMAVYSRYLFFSRGDLFQPIIERRFGFEETDNRHHDSRQAVDSAIEMVDRHMEGGGGEFFLWVHLFDPHEPYVWREDFQFGEQDVDRYHGEIAFADSQIRRLVEHLNSKGAVKENTVLVVAADHGEEFGDHGGAYHGSSLYDEQVRIPLLIRHPAGLEGAGQNTSPEVDAQAQAQAQAPAPAPAPATDLPDRAAQVINEPVQLIDVFPTVLSLAGLNPPRDFRPRGTDLTPALLHGGEITHGAFGSVLTKRMVAFGHHKLIVNYAAGTRELYDLSTDPSERRNVLDQEPERANTLDRMLTTWVDGVLVGTTDPVRRGLALARLKDPGATPILRNILTDRQVPAEARVEAALLLGCMGKQDPETLAALEQAATSPCLVGDCATVALAMLGAEVDQDRLASLLDEGLVGKKLGRAEGDWPGQIARRAAIAMVRSGRVDGVPHLQKILHQEERDYEEAALAALGALQSPEALPPLLHALQPLRTRHWAVRALGVLGHPDGAVPLLQIARNDPYITIRESALLALSMIGSRITPGAGEMLHQLILDEPSLKGGAQALINTGLVEACGGGEPVAERAGGGSQSPSERGVGVVLRPEAHPKGGGGPAAGAFQAKGARLCLGDGAEGYLTMPPLVTGDYHLLASASLADGVGETALKFSVVKGAGSRGGIPGKGAMKGAVYGGELHLPDFTMKRGQGDGPFRLGRGRHLVVVKNKGSEACLESVVLLKTGEQRARAGKGTGTGKGKGGAGRAGG